jgi:hypothetical protein
MPRKIWDTSEIPIVNGIIPITKQLVFDYWDVMVIIGISLLFSIAVSLN